MPILTSNQIAFIDLTDINAEEEDTGIKVYTSRPSSYKAGDLWLTNSDTDHALYKKETLLKAQTDRNSYRSNDWVLAFDDSCNTKTYASSSNVYLDSNGSFGKSVSLSQSKMSTITDVIDTNLDPYKILNIPVKQYQYTSAPVDKQVDDVYIGLISEDVATEYPIAAESGSWNVRTIVAAMLKIIQDQQNALNELTQKVEELQNETI